MYITTIRIIFALTFRVYLLSESTRLPFFGIAPLCVAFCMPFWSWMYVDSDDDDDDDLSHLNKKPRFDNDKKRGAADAAANMTDEERIKEEVNQLFNISMNWKLILSEFSLVSDLHTKHDT